MYKMLHSSIKMFSFSSQWRLSPWPWPKRLSLWPCPWPQRSTPRTEANAKAKDLTSEAKAKDVTS